MNIVRSIRFLSKQQQHQQQSHLFWSRYYYTSSIGYGNKRPLEVQASSSFTTKKWIRTLTKKSLIVSSCYYYCCCSITASFPNAITVPTAAAMMMSSSYNTNTRPNIIDAHLHVWGTLDDSVSKRDRKSTRLNSSHSIASRMPSSA